MDNVSDNLLNITVTNLSSQRAPWWAMFLIGLLMLITILANLLVIASFVSEPRLRIPFNYYILNLAISDMLVAVVDIPHYAIVTYYGYWPLGYAQCSFWMFFDYLATSESLWGIAVISADRVWAVTFPFHYRTSTSQWRCCLVILSSWLIAVLIILPGYVRSRSDYTANSDLYVCDLNSEKLPDWTSAFYLTVFGEWLPVILIGVCYAVTVGRMCHAAARLRQRVAPRAIDRTMSVRQRHHRLDRQAFTLLTLLLLAVLTLWTPWFVVSVQRLLFRVGDDTLYVVAYWVTYVMSAVNPFLFNAASHEMRRTVRRLLKRGERHVEGDVLELGERTTRGAVA